MKREDRLLKDYFAERVKRVHAPPAETFASDRVSARTFKEAGARRGSRILAALAYAAMLATAAVLPFSGAVKDNPLARTVAAVYREYGMETRAEEGIERFFLTLKSRLEEEKNL